MHERQLLDILVRFATTLTADFSIQDVLDHLVAQIVDLLPVTGAGVLLMDDGAQHHFVSATDDTIRQVEGLQLRLGEGPCLVAFDRGTFVSIPDVSADTLLPRFSAAAHAAGLGAVFSFPLHDGGARVGALELYASDAVTLGPTELAGAQTLADVVASYLLIARRREAAARDTELLRLAALHDPLTGLPNRRLLDDRLALAAERSLRSGLPAGILFCDLDDFKVVNDRYGHPAGDRLLAALADRLSATVRAQDTLARVSGDEFVVLCEGVAEPGEAEEVADRILAALQEPFSLPGDEAPLTLHMSIGIALTGPGRAAPDRTLTRADAAMYRAKRLGGGRRASAREEQARPARIDLTDPASPRSLP